MQLFFMGGSMAKEFAKPFYNSNTWKAVRQAYISKRVAIDGGLCETCRQRPGKIVHHIENLTKENISDRLVTASLENLRLDCKFCHDREEGHFIKQKKTLCAFDGNGQPLPPSRK